MKIPAGTGVDPDALALLWRETREREVVQVDETVKELPGGIDLHGKPRFGEVYLNLMCSFLQAASHLGFMLAQQIFDELLPRIARNAFGWVHQAQGRWRYHGLLDWYVRVAHGHIQVRICVAHIAKRAARQP